MKEVLSIIVLVNLFFCKSSFGMKATREFKNSIVNIDNGIQYNNCVRFLILIKFIFFQNDTSRRKI
jgi:hypothetical protein